MYPSVNCERFKFKEQESLKEILRDNITLIPFGNGRSYGDSALNDRIINVRQKDYFIDFDETSGLLHVEAGVLLSEILEHFVPRGWFLNVTPGTKLITVGGAIASDVHGKNHHIQGCFSEYVKEFNIMLANGETITCSKEATSILFRATCGGQGLTGIILDAKIYLKKINSQYIDQTTIKTKNLKGTFEAFEEHKDAPYSVAWIDCLANKKSIGRCLLNVGNFKEDGSLKYKPKKQIIIPFNFPSFTLNNYTVRAFNWYYYRNIKEEISKQKVDLDTFFYPLDTLGHWNRIYGKNGFIQYQFILPKEASYQGLKEILKKVAASGKGSFLAVLKLYGKANDNFLSFPMEGYSLAIDFKIEQELLGLLDKLDEIVMNYEGRIYLAKDARVSRKVFEKGYPKIEEFRKFRKENKMDLKFQSLQSKRLGL